jgi:hypothetical protein
VEKEKEIEVVEQRYTADVVVMLFGLQCSTALSPAGEREGDRGAQPSLVGNSTNYRSF